MVNFTIDELFEAWHRAAMAEWNRGVRDFEPDQVATPDIIHEYFAANSWGAWNGGRYTENEKTSWCGHFAGAVGQRLGAHLGEDGEQVVFPVGLSHDVARFCYPSTRRLARASKWSAAGEKMPVRWAPQKPGEPTGVGNLIVSTDGRAVEHWGEVARRGMTATVKTSGELPRRGDHVVIVTRVTDEGLHTVEGNGRGFFSDGSYGEGVIIRDEREPRALEDIRVLYELDESHFEDWSAHNV